VTARSSFPWFALLVVAAPLAVGGCVIDRTGRSGSSMVLRDIEANSASVAYTREQVETEAARIDAIENRAALARRSLAESTATAENLLESVQEVAGQVQALRHTLEKSARFDLDVDERLADLEFRLMMIEDKLGIEPDYGDEEEEPDDAGEPVEGEPAAAADGETPDGGAATPGPAVAEADPALAPAEDGTAAAAAAAGEPEEVSEESLDQLARALKAVQDERYKQGGSLLTEFLREHPDHPRAGDARNLLGDCLFAMGRYKEAISEYEGFVQAHPQHPSVPQAMFRQGLAFIELGTESDLEAARIFLDDLIEKYPDSPEAEKAKRKIEILE